MTKSNFFLRDFSYINESIVTDYISSILGNTQQEQLEKYNLTDSGSLASLFTSMYAFLYDKELISFPKTFTSEIGNFQKGKLLEIDGTIKPFAFDHVYKTLGNFLKNPLFRNALQKKTPSQSKHFNNQQLLTIFQEFSESLMDRKKEAVKFTPSEEPEFIIVLIIERDFIRNKKDIDGFFGNEFTVLLRSSKILKEVGDRYDIFKFYDIKVGGLQKGPEIMRKMLESLNSPSLKGFYEYDVNENDLFIETPSIIADPVAIYKEVS